MTSSMGLPSTPSPNALEGHRWGKELDAVMGCILIVAALLGLLAFRYPIINQLAGGMVVFPLVTVSAGSLVWAVLIQAWDQLFSLRGYGTTLIVFSVPVALWVVRLNR